MARTFLLIILSVLFIGCTKNAKTFEVDNTWFLEQTENQFRGVINTTSLLWTFGNNFQKTSGFTFPEIPYDSASQKRLAIFGLISEGNGTQLNGVNTVYLYSPTFDKSDRNNLYNLFTLGKKQIGTINTNFHLRLKIGNTVYQSNNFTEDNWIEVLKTEEFVDNLGKHLNLWMRISAKLSACNCHSENLQLKNCYILADFYQQY